jgi:hypothetical protein
MIKINTIYRKEVVEIVLEHRKGGGNLIF